MRRIFFVILIIPAVLISCLSSKSAYSDTISSNSFEVIISLDKETYIEGENVWLKVVINNVSSNVDSIALLSCGEISNGMRVTNEQGISSSYTGFISSSSKSYTIFQPDEKKNSVLK